MTWVEILGFVTGAASVILAVRESAWNWLKNRVPSHLKTANCGRISRLSPNRSWKGQNYLQSLTDDLEDDGE